MRHDKPITGFIDLRTQQLASSWHSTIVERCGWKFARWQRYPSRDWGQACVLRGGDDGTSG